MTVDRKATTTLGRRRCLFGLTALLVAGLAGIVVWLFRPVEFSIPAEISDKVSQSARARFRELYDREPNRIDLLSMIGELSVRDGSLSDAVACFAEIPTNHPVYGRSARLQEAQVLLKLNRAQDAESSLREFLTTPATSSGPDEQRASAERWLAYLLSVELRFEDRKAVLTDLRQQGFADVFELKQLYFPNLLIWNSSAGRQRLAEFLEQDPDNPRLRLAWGRYLTVEGKLEEARVWLSQLHEQAPDDLAVVAAVMECLYEQSDWPGILELARSLPAYATDEPWLLTRLRGEIAAHQAHWAEAADWFQKVLQADLANPWSQIGICRAHEQFQQTSEHRACTQRSLAISKLRVSLVTVRDEAPEMIHRLVALCKELDFDEAADSFQRYVTRLERAPQGSQR